MEPGRRSGFLVGVVTDETAGSAAAAEKGPIEPRNSGWRKTAIVTLLVVASILAPLGVASIWVKNQVTDTSRYVRTVKPLASNQAIQSAVAANLTNALFTRVDVEARAKDVLPPKLKQFAAPVAAGLENFTQDTTKKFLASDAFQKLWVEVNRRSHKQLNKVLTGQGHYVQTAHGEVAIDLAPVMVRIKHRLDERGITIFDRVPTSTVNSKFVIVSSKQLDNAETGAGSTGLAQWVRSAKRPLRIGAILLPIAIFFLWNTPTVSLVIALVALSLFLLLVIELFARAPSEPAGHVPTTTP